MDTCQFCGKDLKGKKRNALYCSPSCRVKACNQRKESYYPQLDKEKILALYGDLFYLANKFKYYEPGQTQGEFTNNLVAEKYIQLSKEANEQDLLNLLAKHTG